MYHQSVPPAVTPVFSRMSSLPDIDTLPLPDAGALCPIESGKEIDDVQYIQNDQYIQDNQPIHGQIQFQQPQMVYPYNNGSFSGTHPRITQELPAPRFVNNGNYELSRNGMPQLSQELPKPQRGNINYNQTSFDMNYTPYTNN